MASRAKTAEAQGRERKRRERVQLTLARFDAFTELYFRPFDPAWPDDAPLPPFGRDMARFLATARRGVIMLAPEFMKTTIGSQAYPLWLTYRYSAYRKLLRGLLLSEEEDMAVQNLSVVKWHIEHNELLAADFCDENGHPLVYPDEQERKWSEDAIVVARTGTSKDPTWQAKGIDSKGKQGRRLDRIIGDDVVTPKNAWSPTMRKRALDTWDLEIETRLVESGQAVMMGNFNDPKDLLASLERRPGYVTFKRPAMHLPGQPAVAATGKAIDAYIAGDRTAVQSQWPEVWSIERQLGERAAKPQRFRRIFLLDSRAERGDRLKVDWVKLIAPDETPLKYARMFLSIDPAPGGETEDLDYFTVTVLALTDYHLDLCQSFAVRCSTPRQCAIVGSMHDRWNRIGHGVIAICASKVSLDSYFRGALSVARPDLDAKVEAISTPGNKLERLEGLGPYAQTGWLRVWESTWEDLTSDEHDQAQELTMREEWKDFPNGRHDDRLDGLDVGIRGARDLAMLRGDSEYSLEVA